MKDEQKLRAHLGFAAMLNSTRIDPEWATPENLRRLLRDDVSDYFTHEPIEASQFIQADMLELLDEYSDAGILQLLHSLGKSPFSQRAAYADAADGKQWHEEIERLTAGELPHCDARKVATV